MRNLAATAALILLALPARAAYEDIGFGARTMGMGDASVALADDLEGSAANPATLGRLERSEVELGSRRLFNAAGGPADIDGMAFGFGVPLRPSADGALGVFWSHDAVGQRALDRSASIAYGTRNWREIGAATLDAGFALKGLAHAGREPGGAITRAAFDLGTYLKLSDDKALGLSMLNVNGPRMDLPGVLDRAPFITKFGFAQQMRRYKVLLDLTAREPSYERRTSYASTLGTECGWSTAGFGSFAARSGLTIGTLARAWSLGAGWRRLGARLDYALRIPLSNGSRWSHAVSLSYRFGTWNPENEYEALLKSEIGYRRDLAKALESAEVKQWKLAEELRALRDEMDLLRKQLSSETAGRGEAENKARNLEREIKLRELEERRREAQRNLEKMQADQERMRRANHQLRFTDDWHAYQDLKLQGASELVLSERLKRILNEFKGTGVDLGEANQELQRLQRR